MIPVKRQPEPADFDAKVRQPGLQWLRQNGLPLRGHLPCGAALKPCWRECLNDLHTAYDGICAYVCVYIEKITGSPSVDHFVAKSASAEDTYEWNNYRLACAIMNSRKRELTDVLDPFDIAEHTFVLELVSGTISPNPELDADLQRQAERTIDRLNLNDGECRQLRVSYFTNYIEHHISPQYLERRNPLVWREVCRQKAFRKERANAPAA